MTEPELSRASRVYPQCLFREVAMGTSTRKFISELLPFWLSRKAALPAARAQEPQRPQTAVNNPAPLRPKPIAPFRPKPEPTDRRSSHL